ncbi:MAG: N-acetylmuramoyl-L-alanine amidase [Rhodobacteraceae bacterium]|nr:N-acetylmuramoyl-L-alanine amidase [Paracoccaceae bacterium]
MSLRLIDRPSPNFGDRKIAQPSILVLHYTGMPDAASALARLCDPSANVSAHYSIDEDGTVYRHVGEDKRAWHAGVAYWRGIRDVNSASIGIELVNPGHDCGYRAFPGTQIDALTELAHDILTRHRIAAHDVVGHSDIAPGRKRDPGEMFPWRELAERGIGFWPASRGGAPMSVDQDAVWAMLSSIGYATPISSDRGGDILGPDGPAGVIKSVQMHYRPGRIDGVMDTETAQIIAELAAENGAIA